MRNKINLIATCLFALSLGAVVAFSYGQKQDVQVVEAAQHYDNFDPYTYSGTYYSSITSSKTGGLNGTLRTTLSALINPTSVPDYSSGLAAVFPYTDEDPSNTNNKIMLYTRDSISKSASGWNREHVWPKNLSNSCWKTGRAGADLLHLRPTYNTTNSTRSSIKYGDVDKSTGKLRTFNNIDYAYTNGNSAFMPLDTVKGDVARICMYVWVAYKEEYGNKMPSLTNVFTDFDTLMTWHINDRPDMMEGHRNDYAQNTSVQHNRNPFVDHPEWAWKIFGDECSASVLSAAKAAYPESGGGETTKTLESITVSNVKVQYNVGDTFVKPTVTAHYSDTSTANVTSSCTFTGYDMSATGNYTVTVSYTEGVTKAVTYQISVNNPGTVTLTGIEVVNPKTEYTVGDTFVKPIVAATYSNDLSADVTDEATFTGYNMNVAGSYTVTVSYTEGETKTTSYGITVSASPTPRPTVKTLTGITVSNAKTEYTVGDMFVKPTVTATYSDNSTEDVSNSEGLGFTGQKMSEPGTYTVKVSYTEGRKTVEATYQITVAPKPASGGCGGNIVTTSVILSSVSLLGVALLIIRKRKARI